MVCEIQGRSSGRSPKEIPKDGVNPESIAYQAGFRFLGIGESKTQNLMPCMAILTLIRSGS